MTDAPNDSWVYVVTDIEVDGPWPGLGGVEHTHRAIDDARGYAHLRGELFRRAP